MGNVALVISISVDGFFELRQVVLVAHDASGPRAIDWSLDHPARVAQLVLLNTYYSWTPAWRAPEAIALYSTPVLMTSAHDQVRFLQVVPRSQN